MTQAKISLMSILEGNYDCHYNWPEDCPVQCGDRGVVFSKEGNYKTAFFEAFPKNPDTFIRGEGDSIEEAEKKAWEKLLKIHACDNHEFEKRGYTNGLGFCKHCNLSKSNAFEPDQRCVVCNTSTNWAVSRKNQWYCEEHVRQIPDEDKFSWQ